jgi:hypothetical protein
MHFLALSYNGPATLLYTIAYDSTQGKTVKTCIGVSADEAKLYEAVGIKSYAATLNKTVLAEFKRVG